MKFLEKKVAFVALLVGSLAIPLTAFAQTYVPPVAYSNFDGFLARHPKTAQELSRNPALANNPRWLEHHPHAKDFFDNHPNARRGMRTNPSQFMSSTAGWGNAWGHNTNAYNYMSRHPQVANDLYRNPRLANDPAFLRRHPNFARFMAEHPRARGRFQQRWAQYHDHDRDHNNQGWHGHHFAYGHDKQDNWKHEHHGNWDHEHHGNWDHGHHGNWDHGHDNH